MGGGHHLVVQHDFSTSWSPNGEPNVGPPSPAESPTTTEAAQRLGCREKGMGFFSWENIVVYNGNIMVNNGNRMVNNGTMECVCFFR